MSTLLETVGPRAGAAPLTYTLVESGTVDIQSVFAHFDGTGASGAWRPACTIKAQNGTILARVSPDDSLAVGDTADVTYAPFLRGAAAAAAASGTVTVISRTEITANVTISGSEVSPTTVITAPAFTADGTSTYAFTMYTPNAATGTAAPLLGNLWEDGVDKGRMWGHSPAGGSSDSVPVMVTRYLVPTAGSHTYAWRSWRTVADGTVAANTGGAGKYMPAYLLIERLG